MPSMTEDQAVQLIKDALSGIESGGNYGVKSPQAAYGKYQFIPSTWETWSKRLTKSVGVEPQVIKQTPDNQEAVATFKIKTLLGEGRSPQEIASIWYSGRPDYANLKGVTDAHGRLDVPGYVNDFYNRFSKGAKRLLSSLGPSEAHAAETQQEVEQPGHPSQPNVDYAAILNGQQPSRQVQEAAESQPNVAGIPSVDYAEELRKRQPLNPADQGGAKPSLMPQQAIKGTENLPQQPMVDDTGLWPLIQASIVDDPKIRMKIMANARGIPIENYFMKDGQTYYVKDGKAFPEISDSVFSKAKELLAGVIGESPVEIGATVGGALGNVPGAMTGAAIGKELQNQLAGIFFGEKQNLTGNLLEDVGAGIGTGIGLGAGKLLTKAGDMILRKGAQAGKVGKLVQRDLPVIDMNRMRALEARGKRFGVDLTAAETSGSPTLERATQYIHANPGEAGEMYRKYIDDVRVPQLEGAIEREIGKVSPVETAGQAGYLAAEAAGDSLGGLKLARKNASQPLYEAVKQAAPTTSVDASSVIDQIDAMLNEEVANAGPTRKVLNDVKRMLTKTVMVPDSQDPTKIIKQIVPEDNILKIDNAKKTLDKMLKPGPNKPAIESDIERRLVGIIDETLDAADSAVPEYRAARAKFAEMSKPINEFLYGNPNASPMARKKIATLIGKWSDPRQGAFDYENAAMDVFGKNGRVQDIMLIKKHLGQDVMDDIVAGYFRGSVSAMRDLEQQALQGKMLRKAVFNTGKQRELLKAAMSADKFQRWSDFMDVLDVTNRGIYGNSMTQPLQEMGRTLRREAGGTLSAVVRAAENINPLRWEWSSMLDNLRYPEYSQAVTEMILSPTGAAKIQRIKRIPDPIRRATELTSMFGGILGTEALSDAVSSGNVSMQPKGTVTAP